MPRTKRRLLQMLGLPIALWAFPSAQAQTSPPIGKTFLSDNGYALIETLGQDPTSQKWEGVGWYAGKITDGKFARLLTQARKNTQENLPNLAVWQRDNLRSIPPLIQLLWPYHHRVILSYGEDPQGGIALYAHEGWEQELEFKIRSGQYRLIDAGEFFHIPKYVLRDEQGVHYLVDTSVSVQYTQGFEAVTPNQDIEVLRVGLDGRIETLPVQAILSQPSPVLTLTDLSAFTSGYVIALSNSDRIEIPPDYTSPYWDRVEAKDFPRYYQGTEAKRLHSLGTDPNDLKDLGLEARYAFWLEDPCGDLLRTAASSD